jgi:hypothetical protein
VNPCARNISSVHPCGLPARFRARGAARRSGRGFVLSPPPLHAGQALARRLLAPIRPRSAPTMPQRVHTMRGPNVGTGTSSDHGSALMIARWWHTQQHTSSDRTPLARMLPSVMGSIGSVMRLVAIRRL